MALIKKYNGMVMTVTNAAMTHGIGLMFDTIQSKFANGGRDQKVKFYWDYGSSGGLGIYVARQLVGGVVKNIADEAVNQYKKLIGGQSFDTNQSVSDARHKAIYNAQMEEEKKYGRIAVVDLKSSAKKAIVALDDWGNECADALMLAIPAPKGVSHKVRHIGAQGTIKSEEIKSDKLVWYDTTALISLSSDKDLVLTRVTGRDYSRKELISNGDLNFSVSGHITSKVPDIYPSAEVQKFRQIVRYKGIIEVNNEFLDQWGVNKIVIKSFNLPSSEGQKSVQDYSFEFVAIQPEKEAEVTEDTVTIIDRTIASETSENDNASWKSVLDDALSSVKDMSVGTVQQGVALAEGFLDNSMVK